MINVLMLMLYTIRQWLWRTAASGNGTVPTHLVNAAIVAGRGNLDKRDPIITYV
jgi:hypothetical protein